MFVRGEEPEQKNFFCSYYLLGSLKRVWLSFFLIVLCQCLLSCHKDRRHSLCYSIFFLASFLIVEISFWSSILSGEGIEVRCVESHKECCKSMQQRWDHNAGGREHSFWELTAKKNGACRWVKMHDKGKRHDISFENTLWSYGALKQTR